MKLNRHGVKWLSPDVSLELWRAIKDFGSQGITGAGAVHPLSNGHIWWVVGVLGNAHAWDSISSTRMGGPVID